MIVSAYGFCKYDSSGKSLSLIDLVLRLMGGWPNKSLRKRISMHACSVQSQIQVTCSNPQIGTVITSQVAKIFIPLRPKFNKFRNIHTCSPFAQIQERPEKHIPPQEIIQRGFGSLQTIHKTPHNSLSTNPNPPTFPSVISRY